MFNVVWPLAGGSGPNAKYGGEALRRAEGGTLSAGGGSASACILPICVALPLSVWAGEFFQSCPRTRIVGSPSDSCGGRLRGACGGSLGQDAEGPQTQASYLSRLPWLCLFGRGNFPKFGAWPGGGGGGLWCGGLFNFILAACPALPCQELRTSKAAFHC